MNLLYRILWIENDFDWAESIEEEIKEYVENQGFIFYKTLIAQKDDSVHYNQYDLILMDLKLSSSPMGDELIQQVRQLGIYTNVVFYSANGIDTIREIGRQKNLEGVYYAGRNKDLFTKKVIAVIDTTIKKVQDLNNLRGLVMAETGELDDMMDQMIVAYFSNEEKMRDFHKHITKDRESSIHRGLIPTEDEKCNKKCKLKWHTMPISDIIKHMESAQKAHALNIVLNNHDFFNQYKSSIIDNRNKLAHCKSNIVDGCEVLVTRDGVEQFTLDKFRTIRQDITKYRKIFEDYLQKQNHDDIRD